MAKIAFMGQLPQELVIDNAEKLDAFIPLGFMARSLYARHAETGRPDTSLDFSSIQRLFQA